MSPQAESERRGQEAPGTTITFPVTGMTCAACQGRVQRALEQTAGVTSAAVNLMVHSATVAFDRQVTSPAQLVDVVRETGYGASLPLPERSPVAEQEAQDRAQELEYRSFLRKALVSLVLGLLAMLLSMPLMSGPGHAGMGPAPDPLMAWAKRVLAPPLDRAFPGLFALDPTVVRVLLLVMTAFVMSWAGRHFYTRAWAALRHHSADMNTLIALGTGAAFLYSIMATVSPGFFITRGVAPDVYYEAVVIILALILLGNALEARAKRQTSTALRWLMGLQPPRARVLRGGTEHELPKIGRAHV